MLVPSSSTLFHHRNPTNSLPVTFFTVQKSKASSRITVRNSSTKCPLTKLDSTRYTISAEALKKMWKKAATGCLQVKSAFLISTHHNGSSTHFILAWASPLGLAKLDAISSAITASAPLPLGFMLAQVQKHAGQRVGVACQLTASKQGCFVVFFAIIIISLCFNCSYLLFCKYNRHTTNPHAKKKEKDSVDLVVINTSIKIIVILISGWCHRLIWRASCLSNGKVQPLYPPLFGFFRVCHERVPSIGSVGYMQHEAVHASAQFGWNVFTDAIAICRAPKDNLSTGVWVL